MRLFERFITEGNEKEDELCKGSSDEGWRSYRAGNSEHCAAGQEKKFMQLCNMQLPSTGWWKNGRIVKSLDQSLKNVQRNIERSGVRRQRHIAV